MVDEPKIITDVFNPVQLETLTKLYFPLSSEERSFFILTVDGDSFNYVKLSDKICATNKSDNFANANLDEIYFAFSDPCAAPEYAGWPLRLFLLMLTHLWYVRFLLFINLLLAVIINKRMISVQI